MTKQEKYEFVQELTEKIKNKPNFYIVDISGYSVSKTNEFRSKCFKENLEVIMVKNTLIEKSLENAGIDFAELAPALKEQSVLIFALDNANTPAKLIKSIRDTGADRPKLKGAIVQDTIFVGDNQLDALVSLKSKKDLIGDVIGLLQSPAKNVVSALKSSGQKIAGILQTLEKNKS